MLRALSTAVGVSDSRPMVEEVRSDDFDQWLRKLEDRVGRLRIVKRMDRLAAGKPGDAKPVGRGVWELRLRFGPGYRVYYLRDGPRVILLMWGGDKSTQQRDFHRAYRLAEECWNEEGRSHVGTRGSMPRTTLRTLTTSRRIWRSPCRSLPRIRPLSLGLWA